MARIARTYRFEPDLVARLEAEAARLGQSFTVFVERAVERALGDDPVFETVDGPRAQSSFRPGEAVAVRSVPPAHHPKCACYECKPSKS